MIVPVYRPDSRFGALIRRLRKQTVPPGRIIVMLTIDDDCSRGDIPEGCEVYTVNRRDFDHAAVRNKGVSLSDTPCFIMMTQDAVPKNRHLIENLLKGLIDDGAAVSFGRQVAYRNSSFTEKLTRSFNYPDISSVRSMEDMGTLGIKAFFCSNVCAAYDREVFDRLGGFFAPAIFNEDMVFARSVLENGLKISYRADAEVFHSHDYGVGRLFRRNFDLAASQKMHPEVFSGVSSEGEGVRYVKKVTGGLISAGHCMSVPVFIVRCVVRYAAFTLGKHYDLIPTPLLMKLTDNPWSWKRIRNAG